VTPRRMLPRGCWVVHTRAEDWQAMELGTVQTLPSGVRGAAYHHIPQGLPGIFLGRLAKTRRRSRGPGSGLRGPRLNPLVKVLWMGRVFMCALDDVTRIP
jgi:hypothetical protein